VTGASVALIVIASAASGGGSGGTNDKGTDQSASQGAAKQGNSDKADHASDEKDKGNPETPNEASDDNTPHVRPQA
jgi:hypothetical protein